MVYYVYICELLFNPILCGSLDSGPFSDKLFYSNRLYLIWELYNPHKGVLVSNCGSETTNGGVAQRSLLNCHHCETYFFKI